MQRHTGWREHATYLEQETPLSTRQAEILALQKTYHTKEEIAEMLKLYDEAVDHHLDEIQEVLT
jgi:DNA-binding NarL/FixJ family response regulator